MIVVLRSYYLEADPPPGLSTSTSVHTDPPLYTWFAKEYVKSGEFNPFHDSRIVVFIPTAVTGLGLVVFGAFGVGFWQQGTIALVFSIGALLLLFLFIRRIAGPLAGIFYALLTACNYNQLMMGRLPFLEHAMIFFTFLSLVLIAYFRHWVFYLLAGTALGIGVFFGKVLGIVLLLSFGIYFLHRWLVAKEIDASRKVLSFAGGFMAPALVWMVVNFLLPDTRATSYFGDIFALYGEPEGLRSVQHFIWKLVSFGDSSFLMERMIVPGLLAVFYISRLLLHYLQTKGRIATEHPYFGGHLFVIVSIIGFWAALMIWEYRPLRYQLILIYLICGAAGMVLSDWWRGIRRITSPKVPVLFYILSYLLLLTVVYKLYAWIGQYVSPKSTFSRDMYVILLLAAAVTVAVGMAVRFFRGRNLAAPTGVMRIAVVLLATFVLVRGVAAYGYWWQRPTFTARDNSLDLRMTLSPGAVLSGANAAQLTLENDLGAVVHMFGTESVDPDFFRKYPVTHVLLDESNENRARSDYPELMDSAAHVVTYHIGPEQVRLFRIAGLTGNSEAHRYVPSILERAIALYQANRTDEANVLAARFLEEHPENLSGYLTVATVAAQHGQLALAEHSFKKAIEFSPTNYHLISTFATFYRDWYAATGDVKYKQESLKQFERAIKLVPVVPKLNEAYHELKESEPWQLKKDTSSLSLP